MCGRWSNEKRQPYHLSRLKRSKGWRMPLCRIPLDFRAMQLTRGNARALDKGLLPNPKGSGFESPHVSRKYARITGSITIMAINIARIILIPTLKMGSSSSRYMSEPVNFLPIRLTLIKYTPVTGKNLFSLQYNFERCLTVLPNKNC